MKIGRSKYLLPFLSAFGLLFGILVAMFSREESLPSLSGGYLHPFPGVFSLSWLYKVILAELLPVMIIYLGGYGYLHRPLSALSLFYRSFLAGFILRQLYLQLSGEVAVYLYIFICLADCAAIGILLSLSRLSALFFNSLKHKFQFKKIKRYTVDALFFAGLILLFYFIKGCIMAVLLHTA